MRKYKQLKKWVATTLTVILLTGLVFTGCSSKDNDSDNNTKENKTEQTKTEDSNDTNDKDQAKDDAKNVQKEFDEYMSELFVDEMSISSVSTHFSLENPEAFGITFEEASWGEPITIESIEEDYEIQKDILDKLETFDPSLLTTEQQITYDTIYLYLENSYSAKDYYLLEELFAPINGIQSELPIIFSEYDFFTAEDIDDYLTLLETSDDYINSLLEYEKIRAEKGYFLTDTNADKVIQQCKEFIEPEENCLVSIFTDKLDAFGVTDEEKAAYLDRFNAGIDDSLIPAYENIIATLEALKGSRSTQLGLSEFEDGEEYYKALVRSYTGSDKTVDELIESVEDSLSDNISTVYALMIKSPELYDEYFDFEYPSDDPKTSVELQIEKAKEYFPETDVIPYEIKSVPKSLEATMSPAFYLVPPIDNMNKNMIYINHSEEYAEMNLFSTLAHEGVPGHMYQCYYFASTEPDPIRNVFNFGGYTEGWATYVESYAYKFAGMDDDLAEFSIVNDRYNFALYCRIDLGIHYESWSLEDTTKFLKKQGITDQALIEELYYTLIDDPAVYLQYYIGYMEFAELRERAEKEVESFNEIEFHRFVLDMGPTFFDVIDEHMDDWIDKQNSL